jgi:hypothetical protein
MSWPSCTAAAESIAKIGSTERVSSWYFMAVRQQTASGGGYSAMKTPCFQVSSPLPRSRVSIASTVALSLFHHF